MCPVGVLKDATYIGEKCLKNLLKNLYILPTSFSCEENCSIVKKYHR